MNGKEPCGTIVSVTTTMNQLEEQRRRMNKRQQALMIERLHANMLLVRGNSEQEESKTMWSNLAVELNNMGCRRTVEEWQSIWEGWVIKTKSKARKVKSHIRATGGGPGIKGLTDLEERILEIVGTACITGFTSEEVGTVPPVAANVQLPEEVEQVPQSPISTHHSSPLPNPPPPTAHDSSTPGPSNNRRREQPRAVRLRNRSRHSRPRPPVNDNLVRRR